MKKIIDEINKSYELFVDADDHARLDDMCKELAYIREKAEELINKCDDYAKDLDWVSEWMGGAVHPSPHSPTYPNHFTNISHIITAKI